MKNLAALLILLATSISPSLAQQPPAPGTDLTPVQLIDTLTKMGAVVKTEGDAPDGAITSIIFPYTHTPHVTPGGNTIPPYPVTDDLVHQISKQPKVTALELNMSLGLTEAAIKDAGGMTQLEHLSLGAGVHLNDTSMADLAGLTKLNYLRLSGAAGISDTGWATLENFKLLQTLWVAETRFGDAAVQHLKPLTQLKDMTFYGTPITDAGADVLLGLPNLISVRCGPHMTPTEVAKLQAALPKCRFWR